jgi:hypothetical protein
LSVIIRKAAQNQIVKGVRVRCRMVPAVVEA